MLFGLLFLIQLIPSKSYDLNIIDSKFNQFEIINNDKFLLYNKNSSDVTVLSYDDLYSKQLFIKDRFKKEAMSLEMLADDSFIIKLLNNDRLYRYNEHLELIKVSSVNTLEDFNYFVTISHNKSLFFNDLDNTFILYDLLNNSIIFELKSEEQKHFTVNSIQNIQKQNQDILIFDDKSVHYFDLNGRFIRTVNYKFSIRSSLLILSKHFILYENGNLLLNGEIFQENVLAIRKKNEALYLLINKVIYRYDI